MKQFSYNGYILERNVKNTKILLASLICVYGSAASANIIITSRLSTSAASASHQTLTGQDRAFEQDSDTSTAILGFSGSSATLSSPYSYGASSDTSVSLSGNTLYISGGAGAEEPTSGSFSNTSSNSHIELYFTVDSLTHVDIELNEYLAHPAFSTGLMQLFSGSNVLASVLTETDFDLQVPFPENLSLDLSAGNYKIVGDYFSQSLSNTCGGRSCFANGSMSLTTSSLISTVPLPSGAMLMASSLIALMTAKKRKNAAENSHAISSC